MTEIPNQHRIWPLLVEVKNPSYKRPQCKIPTSPCDEPKGISAWHLLALGVYPRHMAVDLLKLSTEISPSIVFDDLLEHVSKPPSPVWVDLWRKARRIPSRNSFENLVGLGIEGICRMQGLTLLGHYLHEGILREPMNPAVLCFERWISEELYGQPRS